MVNDKMLNGFMEKKQYINPSMEVVTVNGGYMMYGPASLPKDPFSAPALRAPELPNDSVPVF